MKRYRIHFIILGLFLIVNGCNKEDQPGYQYTVPPKTNDGWNVSSADEVGLNSIRLAEMVDHIKNIPKHNIHSIVIIKNNNLVFEKYFEGYLYSNNPPGSDGNYILYDMETDHFLASVSKSVTSVIFGAAVKAGYIESVDTKLSEIIPAYKDILTGDKADITLKHLLTMSSGLHWDEWSTSYEDPANDVVALFNTADPIEYILSKEMINSPGNEFLYNSGGTNILGAVIQKETGMSTLEFANEYLFDPLNMQGGSWESIAGGYLFASGGLYLRPRELAKIGFLFLNNGYWDNNQIISEDWIEESTSEYITTDNLIPQAHSYGYQWWIMDFNANNQKYDCFFAAGWGDQYMFIFPDQELIIIFNCGNFKRSGSIPIFSLVENYILPGLN